MGNTIADERRQMTLGIILSTPAPRVPLFLGRALPVIVNGFVVVAVRAGRRRADLLDRRAAGPRWLPIIGVTAVCAFSCTGLGLVGAALSLRVRETAVLANVIFGVLLVFCGVNVPLDQLPGWMAAVADYLPLTHGIGAARELADGAAVSSVARRRRARGRGRRGVRAASAW